MGLGKIGKIGGSVIGFGIGGPVGAKFGAKLGGGLDSLLRGKQVGPDAEAGAIKQLKLQGLMAQAKSLEDLEKMPGGAETAIADVAREQRMLSQGAGDQRSKLQQLMAQRGMGGTSMGTSAELGLSKQFADQKMALQASLPGRMRELELQRLQNRAALGSGLAGSVGNIPLRFQSERKGGLAGLLGMGAGAGLGGFFGGPAGAQAGAQIGGGLGQYYQAS